MQYKRKLHNSLYWYSDNNSESINWNIQIRKNSETGLSNLITFTKIHNGVQNLKQRMSFEMYFI